MKNNRREKRHYRQHLCASATEVFPLICPVEEAKWLDGFTYQMIYSDSGVAEQGCVFMTSNPDEPDTIWTITRHDIKEKVVVFLRVTPQWLVTEIEVHLTDMADGQCSADITYTYTALGPLGDAALDARHSQKNFEQMAKHWESSLNRYLSGKQTARC
ncbi:MAG: hypothetical protein QNJ97_09690 [Myxococcota bacterium]|nr:hypothetical protein [Myxococcota bacterium]